MVFVGVRVKQPRSIAGRSWNFVMDAQLPGQLILIVLKLTRVITWSWWWVLSPLWFGGILVAGGLCAILALVLWGLLQGPARPVQSFFARRRRSGYG